MTGHEEALEGAVKKAVITFNEVLANHGSNLSGAQMGHQFLAMQAAISTYTAKVGGEDHAGLLADLREVSEFLRASGGDGKTIYETGDVQAKAADAIETQAFELGVYRRGEDDGYQHTLQELTAAEARAVALEKEIVAWTGRYPGVRRSIISSYRTALSANSHGDGND